MTQAFDRLSAEVMLILNQLKAISRYSNRYRDLTVLYRTAFFSHSGLCNLLKAKSAGIFVTNTLSLSVWFIVQYCLNSGVFLRSLL